jgi:septal ring factor EnvC (AmiA/AmiB activator)
MANLIGELAMTQQPEDRINTLACELDALEADQLDLEERRTTLLDELADVYAGEERGGRDATAAERYRLHADVADAEDRLGKLETRIAAVKAEYNAVWEAYIDSDM